MPQPLARLLAWKQSRPPDLEPEVLVLAPMSIAVGLQDLAFSRTRVLTAAAMSFEAALQDVATRAGHTMTADAMSVAAALQDIDLSHGYTLTADAMSVVAAMQDVTLTYTPVAGAPEIEAQALNIEGTSNSSRALALSGVAGDLFVVCVQVFHSGRSPDAGPGAGWTDLFGGTVAHDTQAAQQSRWMYRKLEGAESNPAFTISGGDSSRSAVTGVKITGSNASPIDDADPNNVLEDSNDPLCPASTTTVTDTTVLRWFTAGALIATEDVGYPSSTTGLFARSVGAGQNQSVGLAWHEQASAGSTGTAEFTDAMAASGRSISATIVIAP